MPAGRKEVGDTGGPTAVPLKKVSPPFGKAANNTGAAKPTSAAETIRPSSLKSTANIKPDAKVLKNSVNAKEEVKPEGKSVKIDPKPKIAMVGKNEVNLKPVGPPKASVTNAKNPEPISKAQAKPIGQVQNKFGNVRSAPQRRVSISSSESDEEEEEEEEEEVEEEEELTEEESSEESIPSVSEKSSKSNDGSIKSNDGSTKSNDNNTNNSSTRSTFRPPWVKEGPTPLPVPSAPWQLNKRGSRDSGKPKDAPEEEPQPGFQMPQLRKISQAKIQPLQENGAPKESTFVKPQLKPVPPKEARLQSKEVKIPIKLNSLSERLEREESIRRAQLSRENSIKEPDPENIEKAIPSVRNALVKQESLRKIPKAPPLPPPAPAMPKPYETKNLSETQIRTLEALRARPKTRPDWTAMLKDIEGGKKLKHVQCNDRSQPLLPEGKAKGKFLYDSEKANAHNVLLKEIQQGIHLKKVKTNDRSKPVLEGLRKFRRQMTIEEQIMKSQSMASIAPDETIADEVDEMDDIDKVRDDLQSTKQLLALELRNKEAQIRENKKLMARIQHLEAELDKEKSLGKDGKQNGSNDADDKEIDFFSNKDAFIIKSLKDETEEARRQAEELERKFTSTAEELDAVKAELEELKKHKQEMEKRLQEGVPGKRFSMSERKESIKEDSEEENFYEDSEPESDGEETEEKKEKKALREVKMLRNKLRSYKTKQENAKKERAILKDLLKKNQQAMREEKKKYRALQKEVNKMATLMKDFNEDEENEEEQEEEEKPESDSDTETESESESESSGEDSEVEKSESEPEDAPTETKRENLTNRTKRHENVLNALKKGNYVLKTNVERLQDDLNKQKEATMTLQEDLDSVLSELG